MYRRDVLAHAYRVCRGNAGSAGVDGETFAAIESCGVDRWLAELAEELRKKTHRPGSVLRVRIPKAAGGSRPLGIPTIRDRVVQTAVTLVLGPIFEADLLEEQYAYRRGRSALDGVRRVHSLLNTGHVEVIDADLAGYFDSIPHAALMKSVARRISDGQVLCLIKMWLQSPVEEIDKRGRCRRTTQAIVRDLAATPEEARTVKGTRFVLLKNPWNLSRSQRNKLAELQQTNKRLYRAYLLKETLAKALEYRQPWRAEKALDEWLAWGMRPEVCRVCEK